MGGCCCNKTKPEQERYKYSKLDDTLAQEIAGQDDAVTDDAENDYGRAAYRRNRYAPTPIRTIWDCQKPNAIFKNSNYLRHYNKFDVDELSDDKVWRCIDPAWTIGGTNKRVSDTFLEMTNSLEEKCVRLWTLQSPFYHALTQSLYEDNNEQVKKFIPVIRGMNKYIVKPTDQEMTCWRGSKMTKKMWDFYKQGNEYRAPSFGAMSRDKTTALGFKLDYMLKLKVPKNCYNAARIPPHLNPHGEKEVLMPPYSAFKVLQKNEHLKQLDVQVLDNKQESEYLKSAFI